MKWSTALALLAGLSVTALLAHWLQQANQQQLQAALASTTEQTADAVIDRINLYQYGLRGARGAVLTSGERGISRALFLRYSKTRDVDKEFPGARGFGFIRRVPKEQEASFLAQARADGKPDFSIRHLAPHDGERFIIQYIEPVERNLAAVGLDIASEKTRREAALTAMRSGGVSLSGPITLVQATGKPLQSFLILMPIYRDAVTPSSPAERMNKGFGWSYAPLLTEDVLSGLRLDNTTLHLRLRDITDADNNVLFYEASRPATTAPEILSQVVERDIFGRRWQIELSAYPPFAAHLHQTSPSLVYFIGGLLSLMFAALTGVLDVNRQRRRQIFAEQARLAAIVESSSDGIIGKTLNGTVTSWNKGAEQIFGYSAEEAVGRTLTQLIVPPQLADEEAEILRRVSKGEPIQDFETLRKCKDGSLLDVSAAISPIRDEKGQVIGVSKTVRNISERKANEAKILELNANLEQQVAERTAELKEINVLLSSVLDAASEVAIIATDTAGTISIFNRGAQNLLGYNAAEIVGKQTPAIIHVADEVARRGEELSHEYGVMIRGFRVFVHKPELEGAEIREWTYVRKDGTTLRVSLAVTAIRDSQDKLVGYLGIAIDITQQKEAERRIAESLATTRAILDTAVNPVITFNADGFVQSFNPAAQRAFGYSAEEMAGRSLFELISTQSHARLQRLVEGYVGHDSGAKGNSLELAGLHRGGEEFPIQLSIGSMPSAGQPLLVGVITDLSQQVALRQEVLAARDQLMMAADVAQLGIWSWTLENDDLQWNDRMYELYDQPLALREQGLNYQHWYSRVHPEDADVTAAKLQAAVAGQGVYEPIFRIVRSDGQVRFIQAGAQVERNAEGKAIKVTGINLDITAQHEVEAQLRYAKEQADAASAAKSAFLANMSHEIRTPMNAVLGMLQLVQATDLTPRQLDYLHKAHGAAQSLLGLLNDILDYSKIEAGKLQLDLHAFELEPLMRDLAVILAGNQGQKDVEVMFDLDPQLPESLIGDSLRLQQILINLAGNALKFTEHGQVVVSLRQLDQQGQTVRLRIAISDTGIGISEDQLERIFEGFSQAEASTTRRFGGTGLGLVICKRLIALMGGELQVASRVGEGSRFWFDIELKMATQSSLRASCSAIDSNLRLLVVDDNAVAGELLMQLAGDLGWQARYANSGITALREIEAAAQQGLPFQLVLMDWRMPGMDGLATAQRLDALHLEKPPIVVMITAHGREVMSDLQQEGMAPFSAFLTKPVTPMQLSHAIQLALHGQQTNAQPARPVPPARLAGLHLLVVEDNALNRQVAQELLQGEGAQVQLAEDGQAGVTAVLHAKPPFDAVLMDIQMPGMDGLEATRLLRGHAHLAALPIIAMTANASRVDRDNCLDAGMNEHVGKPIDLEQLVHTLLHWTGRSGEAELAPRTLSQDESLIESRESVLRRFGDNLQLLRNVLGSFETEMRKQLDQLEACANRRDARGAMSVLHTLKGSAGTMGAKGLSREAERLEQRLKQAAEPAQLELLSDPAWLAALGELLTNSARELTTMFAAPAPLPTQPSAANDDWHTALPHLLDLLASGNLQAVDQAQALASSVPEQWSETYAELLLAIEGLDFKQAQRLGQALLLAVQGA
ncbi:PAS domain S-box protein [Pseudomonas sp. BMS12]|uniref:PAS domain S-box protein n=1 Tax=Pseudomonas sp. BMS12 TaxID=1796033 RepID=UPI00191C29A9|nr:PAS domain S-box protein [Pseudomonas sp. BMS12]